ncbi:MAG: hypothetical protein IME92_08220 [Proteobacteria bacterium]|nr:hypothetical protein [Pseudomonadota bacterium]
MNRSRGIYLGAFLAISLIGGVWFFAYDKAPVPAKEISQAVVCDACAARHKNLIRLRDAGGLTAKTGD